MIIALLFNWRAYPPNRNYWHEIRKAVFTPGLIQRSGRHMKLSIGDVLTGLSRGQNPEALYHVAFESSEWRIVNEEKLLEGFPTIFGMVFENMSRYLAEEIDKELASHFGYLGSLSVHLEFPPHLALYRACLPPRYRLIGNIISSFFSMGSDDDCDNFDLAEMKELGYDDASFEDTGAYRTILDDFDTPRHFERVAVFRNLLLETGITQEDDAYQLTMMLEDLSPKLFNALGAAAERLSSAQNEEEIAQVALSGRRYMEQLADLLFPASENKRGNRKLDKPAYKNRLWAFVQEHVGKDEERLKDIGTIINQVISEFNAALHDSKKKDEIALSIALAARLTALLLILDPKGTRNGYAAYEDSISKFTREVFKKHYKTPSQEDYPINPPSML